MKHINRRFKVDDPVLRQLNFIMVDLDLQLEKVETQSAEDFELLQALYAERQDFMRTTDEEMPAAVIDSSTMAPEVQVAKHFKALLADDARFANCNVNQSTQLLKQDKILRSQVVAKLKELTKHLKLSD